MKLGRGTPNPFSTLQSQTTLTGILEKRNGQDGAMDVTEPAQTEYVALALVGTKKDGTLQFCVNYHKLITVTIWNSYLILHMDECIDALGDATISLTLDANCIYLQL